MIRAVDLFAGAGGASTGLAQAVERAGRRAELVAINHWPTAVETHAANHPTAKHYCAEIDSLNPRKVVRGKLDVLLAGPSCVHHSNARGGRPMNEQDRASAWCVIRWAEALQPRYVLCENVSEFRSWGPLDTRGRPMKSRKGETYQAWLAALRALGYRTSERILCAANYGDATTRRRLFVLAWRGRSSVAPWPAETHAEGGQADLFGQRLPWRAAREIIDWSIVGTSIFGRKKPLAPKTLARIAEGLRRFGGPAVAESFLAILRGTGTVRDLDQPLPAITAQGEHLALVEPFMIGQQSGAVPRPVREPVPTLAAAGAVSLVEPFLVPRYGEREGQAPRTHGINEPLPTIPGTCQHALAEPSLTPRLDIRFRMLAPHELAAAQGFPADYQFRGTRTDVVRQIGNAWPVNTARSLCAALIGEEAA